MFPLSRQSRAACVSSSGVKSLARSPKAMASSDQLTVALDTNVTPELRREGIARELVNRLQNLRKETNLAVTDRIRVSLTADDELKEVLQHHQAHICTEILCTSMELVEGLATGTEIELTDTLKVFVELAKA